MSELTENKYQVWFTLYPVCSTDKPDDPGHVLSGTFKSITEAATYALENKQNAPVITKLVTFQITYTDVTEESPELLKAGN